jgi:hypothetical protein
MNICLGCREIIGPTERHDCPTYRRGRGGQLTNGDTAVFVLEASKEPLSLYDIHRGIEREFGWAPERNSLNATVALDRRCCWAGRGLYGLWRHGLIPRPRKLADAVRLLLYCHDEPLSLEELSFTMRHLGYRFRHATLYRAVTTAPTIKCQGWAEYSVKRSPGEGTALRADFKLGQAFEEVAERIRNGTLAALRERRERLASERGLADNDPIYIEGELPVLWHLLDRLHGQRDSGNADGI